MKTDILSSKQWQGEMNKLSQDTLVSCNYALAMLRSDACL